MAALTVQSSSFFPDHSNKTYPLIPNVMPESDVDKDTNKISQKYGEVSFAKVLKLLTDKYSKNLIDRHYRAIKRLFQCYKHGIHLRDVKVLLEILKRCYGYINIDSRYEELACMLLVLFRQPFLKSKVSDEGKYVNEISDCLSEIGHLSESSSDNLKCATATAISQLYTSVPKENFHPPDVQPVSTTFIKNSTAQSTVCKSIAECLVQVSNIDSKYTVLKALNHLSNTDVTCDDMLKADVAACICMSLEKLVDNYKLLFVAVETLWNLLEHGNNDQISNQLSSEECLRSLKSAFIKKMNNCKSHADRQLRNDIFVLITLIISKCPNAPFVESGLIMVIASYTSYPEVPTRDEKVVNIKLTKQQEDFELKKLFMSSINVLCNVQNSQSMLQILSHCQVMLSLFSYVKPIKHPLETFWNLAEFEELQLQAMSVLAVLGPLCIEDYIEYQGNARLLSVLDWCINSEEFGGQGNSFHGFGGRGSKRAQMRYCIRLLRSICCTGNLAILQDLTDQGIITQLIAILSSCSNSKDGNDAVDIELQCDMLYILSVLCEDDSHRKELFGENGVKMLIQYLHGYLNVKNGPLHHNKMILSSTDCIWSAVVGCYLNEICFLQEEGAFMLLDFLEECPEKIKNIVLGALVDLTENKNTLPHIHMWRGKDQKTVGKLLVDLWIAEETKLGVKRQMDGVIYDVSCPLKTVRQEEDEDSHVVPFSYVSAAVVEVSDNLRSKIYGMFSRIGFNNVPGLLPIDYVTLTIIEKYLDFKTLEIWQEIRDELEAEDIEPISPDKECMDAIISSIQEKALEISTVQRSLINNTAEQEIIEELEYYDKIRESYKQEEKQYDDFVNFVNRTSDATVLKEARRKQLKMIEKSRLISRDPVVLQDSVIVHNTMETTLNTTSFCGKHISVKSTKFGEPVTRDSVKKNVESHLHLIPDSRLLLEDA